MFHMNFGVLLHHCFYIGGTSETLQGTSTAICINERLKKLAAGISNRRLLRENSLATIIVDPVNCIGDSTNLGDDSPTLTKQIIQLVS